MPFKRNPIRSEKIDSLARFLSTLPTTAWNNAAHTLLERTLDDSANRREILPAAFLTTDEILKTMNMIISGIRFHTESIERNLATYGVFAATERLLMELGRRGGDRQDMHEVIREHSLVAWEELQKEKNSSLRELLASDPRITKFISKSDILDLLDASEYIGDARERALLVAGELESLLTD